MDRRVLLLTSGAIFLGTRFPLAQDAIRGVRIPDLDEFTGTIADEARSNAMISGVRILRDVLLLDAEPESPDELKDGQAKFTELVAKVRSGRHAAIDAVKGNENLLHLSPDFSRGVKRIG